jgi:(4S)-4-hydroxy-5-phosphonooxypentane-2,3-dione isomerase
MHTTIVHIHVKPEHIADFVDACRKNHEAAIKEPGNRRFDVLQSAEKPGWFVLYEAYSSADAAATHKQTEHYARWRDTVADWMAAPRKGLVFNGLFPAA